MKEEVIAEKTSARQTKDKLWLVIRSWKTVLLGLVLALFGVMLAGGGTSMLVVEGKMRLPLLRSSRALFGLREIEVATTSVGQELWRKNVFMVALRWPETRIVVSDYSDMLNARPVANKISTFVGKPMRAS